MGLDLIVSSTADKPSGTHSTNRYWCHRALLPGGWARGVLVTIEDGWITDVAVDTKPPGGSRRIGTALPGMPNTHSHAFQRAMAGLTEYRVRERDSFWTWRETMYRFANRITPDDQRHIAAQLYVEMLKAGYTTATEFHYLHHSPGGSPYDRISEMSQAIMDGAELAGINLTQLPVLYMTGGFDGRRLAEEQRRFGNTIESYLGILNEVAVRCAASEQQQAGLALHSLRAVPPEPIHAALEHMADALPDLPVHIHIAEQTGEVDDCVAERGQRPVEWLLDNCAVDDRWCLVHATHLSDAEVRNLAQSRATVGLCPTTEANLGDGVFPLPAFLEHGGSVSVGSDSNTSVNLVEELRWLEYGQRLTTRSRNVVADGPDKHSGQRLFELCLHGGRSATGQQVGRVEAGYRADLLVVDDNVLAHTPDDFVLDRVVFGCDRSPFSDVMVAGRWLVQDFRHAAEGQLKRHYNDTLRRLLGDC